jgi:NAD(P)H-hydrate epimerase
MEPLPDAQLMRDIDAWAIKEKGVASLDLMERAGEGLARVAAEAAPDGRIVVVCGKGNNGGDGLVAARLLREEGREVDVVTTGKWSTPDAKANAARLPGPRPQTWKPDLLTGAALVIDALLGTGATGAPRDPAAGIIGALNGSRVRVVAADIPSGVDASTGEVASEAVRAVATATFHRSKPGLWIHPGKAHAGRVEEIDIGIPRGAPGDAEAGLIRSIVLRGLPRREAHTTKFSSGVVLILGGSSGLSGAPALAAMAAMRAGAGYVTVGGPASLELAFAVMLVEPMFVGLPEVDGALAAEAIDPTIDVLGKADVAVMGPGLSKKPGAFVYAREMFERIDVPLVLDADGLNALEGCFPEDLPYRRWPTIMTPHAGELARMLGIPSADVNAHRLDCAREAAAKAKAFVVLKGDDTIVATPKGRIAISRGGAPALATAGTGDVLAGVIAAMLARGLTAAQACCAGVHLHARAGQLAAQPHGPDGVIASDVIAALPAALGEGRL